MPSQRLIDMQYERNEIEFKRGVFRVRGDVLDIFPAESAEHAVRVSLFDDEVESMSLFDPLTGHILHKVPRYTVYPSSHYVTPRSTTLRAIDAIKVELRERMEFYYKENKLVEAQRMEQRTRFDLEMMNELGFCKGIENYSRHLSGRNPGEPPPTLIDYLPPRCADVHRRIATSPSRRSAACTRATARARKTWSSTASACLRRWITGRCASMNSSG